MRGDFFSVKFLGGLLPWKEQEAKIHPKVPQQNSNQDSGVSQPKSTLQGSVIDQLEELWANGVVRKWGRTDLTGF